MKTVIKLAIGISIILLIIVYVLYYPVKVDMKLILVDTIVTSEKLSYWRTVCAEDDEVAKGLKKMGIKIPEIDFKKNNLIVSQGKEIKSISYKRISCFHNPMRKKAYLGKAEYGSDNNQTIYFYEIKKVMVMYNVFSDPI